MRACPLNGGVPGLLCATKSLRRLFSLGCYPTTRSEARPVHPVSYTHLTLPTILRV